MAPDSELQIQPEHSCYVHPRTGVTTQASEATSVGRGQGLGLSLFFEAPWETVTDWCMCPG